jgi:hypothetical protein
VARYELLWGNQPRRLWNLLEMIEFVGWSFCGMYADLNRIITELKSWSKLESKGGEAVTREFLANPCSISLDLARGECAKLDLPLSQNIAHSLMVNIGRGKTYSIDALYTEFEALKTAIFLELSDLTFAYISSDKRKYFEQEKLFGEEVYDKFERARADVKDAGNCLAASLATASVFHSMRVAEHGLRRLAKKLRVKITHTGKPCPLEFADWEKIIMAIKNKITEARHIPAGPKRQQKLEAYSNAADHCEYMKDIWRNNMAHNRKAYLHAEALGVFERVRDFMMFLGKYV